MGKGVNIRVLNSKAVIEDLNSYGKDTQREIFKAAWTSGYTIQAKAKVRVPIDTGRLRSSITTTKEKKGVKVGTNVVYAPFVEHGTAKMRGRPYLKNSFKEEVPKFIAKVKRILKR